MSVHPSPELRSLFEAALNEFETRVGTNLVQHQIFNNLVACQSIESVVDILQGQNNALRTSLGDHSTLMKWIKRTVHGLHSLSTNPILVSGVSSAFPPAKAVFAAIGILLSAIKNVDKSYDTLVDLFESFDSFLRRLDIYTKIPFTTAMTEVIVKILTELLSTISLAIQQVRQGRLKKLGKKILGENDREVEAILQRLDRLTLEEARMTGTTTLEVVYDLLKNMKMVMDDKSALMDDVRRALVDMQQVASNMNKLRRDDLQEKIRRWLSPPDPSINHNTARDTHHEGSARWFIDGNTFQQWKMETGSLLWVSGKPGSGKSILSFSIIEDITKSHEAGLASIAFFYFDFKDESKKNARGALSSLLVQLAAQSDSYSDILSALYSKHDAGSKQPSNDGLKKCLETMLAIPDQAPIYIIIDALDECPNSTDTPSPREKVLSLVEWLVELRRSNLWVCVTSRPEADIENILRPLASHTVSLHGETGQEEDIINYIKWFVYSDPKARKWRKQDKELVIEKLSERAYGMFRWVFCQLDRLRRCIVSRIRHALDELPETLDETYERTLLDIDKENWACAHRLFQCLVVALRPLRVKELAEFLAFEFEDGVSPIFQADCRPEDPREAVLSTCSSLISVVGDDDSAIVQFSHFSVKEYLTSTRIAEGYVSRYYTPLEPAHVLVTRACLSILLQLEDQITKELTQDFPLVHYAALYWAEHAKFENTLSQTEDMVKQLFDPRNPQFAAWVRIHDPEHIYGPQREYLQPAPLYHAARLDLCGVAEWLVNMHSQKINAVGGRHGTPFHAASANGSLEVAQFLLMCHADGNRVTVPQPLLDQSVDINAVNDLGETPLTVAIKYGPMKTLMETTNLLLDHGANPNSTPARGRLSPMYGALERGCHDAVHLLQRHDAHLNPRDYLDGGKTLLHVASEMGDMKVAEGLLELGADVNSRDNQGRTPLHEVVYWEREDIALLLLERGADPGVQDDDGQTPLHIVSQMGNLKFARRLLELGVNVNSHDKQGRTPLHEIDLGGRTPPREIELECEKVALLLLERGADPGVQDDDGQSPLHIAAQQGSLKFARRLLGLGVDVNSHDKQGRTPSHVSLWWDEDVTLLLLEHGADPGLPDDDGQTLLHVASSSGRWKSAQHLLELGADVNSRDNQGRTPLHVINWESEDIALLLLEHGADPGIWDDDGQTPLHIASQYGMLEFAQRLLELGADVNLRDSQGSTPLHVVWWKSSDLALLLLEHGANPGVRDDAGRTPLHVASQSGSLKFAQRLLELGADINSRGNQGRTPLHVIHRRNEDVALLLLEHGADPGVQDDAGQTPLHAASRSGCLRVTQWLLNHSFDANSRDNQGRTPAISSTSDNVALLLLKYGADPVIQDNNGQTPLHTASQYGNLKFARRLLELGADVNSRDDQGRTLLHVLRRKGKHGASQEGDLKFAFWLLALGADVNSRDNQGRTPLHVIHPWSEDVTLLLLEHGADPGVWDDAGQTPLHAASRSRCLRVTQWLLNHGFDANSRDNQGRTPVISSTRDDVALLLLKYGADPVIQDDNGQTPLHTASQYGNLKFARRLLELGADVNSRDNQGRTPLHVIRRKSEDVALLLLDRGADPGIQDDSGQTPLHAASRLGHRKLARRLLGLGFDVNSQDNQGRTPLHVIEWWSNGDVRVPRLLLEGGAEQGIRDNNGHTPLLAVARWGKLEVTHRLLELDFDVDEIIPPQTFYLAMAEQWCGDASLLLLKHSADPCVRDNDGLTPLHVASREGNQNVAQQLLKFHVDINSHDNQGRTPFMTAVEGGHKKVEKLLLEHGAERP